VTTTVREFPVGSAGDDLFAGLAPLRALRDLGQLDDERKADYELTDAKTQLSAHFGATKRTLVLGGSVYGGRDRYVIDVSTGRAYVVPGEVVQSLSGADASLRERKVLPFEPDQVAEVAIRSAGLEKVLVRGTRSEGDGPAKREVTTWAEKSTPAAADQTLANLMSRVEGLAPMEFDPNLDQATLTAVTELEYKGKGGTVIGHLRLFKGPGPKPDVFEYYLQSERTRVLAKVSRAAAERVLKDMDQLLGLAEATEPVDEGVMDPTFSEPELPGPVAAPGGSE
jgi:hypothetical protein